MTKEKKAAKAEVRTLIPETVRKAGDKISGTIRDYNQKYVVVTLEKGRKKAKGYNEKYVSKPIEKGVAEGRKMINKIPMVKTVEKKMTDGLQRVPAMFNMPSKGEIEKLNIALENLNSSIETLKKTQ